MELGDFTLADYIAYHGDHVKPSVEFDAWEVCMPVFLLRGCSRILNAWTITSHIAGGLEFLHMHHHVHRDLKPSNGMSPPWSITEC
jgi:serine/threonine protein kinase